MYYDTVDYYYCYAPGAIYQVDPAIEPDHVGGGAAGAGLVIGQPLPTGL